MYLSVAKMEHPEETPPPAVGAAHSPQFVPSPNQSSTSMSDSRGLISAGDLDIEQVKNILPSEPVFAKSRAPGTRSRIPAVRMTSIKHGESMGIFPLSRIELGEIWWRPEDHLQWEITPVEGGWRVAMILFKDYIDYPLDYLNAITNVLRTQQYLDNTPFKWTRWKLACRTTNVMLNVLVTCNKCHSLRSLSMRTLYSFPKNTREISVICENMGLSCMESSTSMVEYLQFHDDVPLNVKTEIKTEEDTTTIKQEKPME